MEYLNIQEDPIGLGQEGRRLQYKTIWKAILRMPSSVCRTGIRSQRCAISRLRPIGIRIPLDYKGRGKTASSIAQNEPNNPEISHKEQHNPQYVGWRQE